MDASSLESFKKWTGYLTMAAGVGALASGQTTMGLGAIGAGGKMVKESKAEKPKDEPADNPSGVKPNDPAATATQTTTMSGGPLTETTPLC